MPKASTDEVASPTVAEEPRPENKEVSDTEQLPKSDFNRTLSVASFVISLIALVTSFYVGYGQLVVAERAADIADDTLLLSQRAWISIQDFDYDLEDDEHYLRFFLRIVVIAQPL